MTDDPLMSNKDQNSKEKKEGFSQKEDIQYKRPDFILLDDRHQAPRHRKQTHFDSNGDPSGETSKQIHVSENPFSLRVLCFLGLIFCLIFGTGLFLFSSLMTAAAILLLFQNEEVNQTMKAFWKLFSNVFIVAIGCLIGLVSPPLGIGMMAIYFSLSGEKSTSDLLKTIIKRFFSF